MQTTLGRITTDQLGTTEDMLKKKKHLLDFILSQAEQVLTFKTSDMILEGHKDAGYLNEKSHSWIDSHWFVSNNTEHYSDNGIALNIK